MILIGQYDSPFVRRVAIAMHLESSAILDALDEQVGPERALPVRRDGLRLIALATGLCRQGRESRRRDAVRLED